MNYAGLVSVTHRDLSADAIVDLAVQAGLDGIEWGGDVHVPHGNISEAKRVGCVTRDAGLAVSAYGSYYRVGVSERDGLRFESVLASADALRAPVIRVWAGTQDFEDADADSRKNAVADLRRICAMAERCRITVAMEYHFGTLNSSPEGTRYLIRETGAENLKTFWQPQTGSSDEAAVQSILGVQDFLSNVHVFHWPSGRGDQTLLEEASERWIRFVRILAEIPGRRFLSLEFVKDSCRENTIRDAAVLRRWLEKQKGRVR